MITCVRQNALAKKKLNALFSIFTFYSFPFFEFSNFFVQVFRVFTDILKFDISVFSVSLFNSNRLSIGLGKANSVATIIRVRDGVSRIFI